MEQSLRLAKGQKDTLTLRNGTFSGVDLNHWLTADTAGTAEIFAIGGNPTTGALYVQDLSGASGTTTVQMVSGTLNVGTVVVSSSSGGTNVNVITGTLLNTGTNVNVVTGTLLNTGTVINVATGTQQLLTTLSNLTNGSVNVLTGTVTSVTNLAGGTVQINPDPVPTMLLLGTQGTAGGSFFATISAAAGAGTKHFVSHVDIVVESGTADVCVLAGSLIQGTGVLAAGKFTPGGGIHSDFNPAFETGTNSELVYHFVGAGTAFIKAYYWKGT